MKSKDEIEQIKGVLKTLRLILPPVLFLIVTLIFASVFGAGFGISALIGLLAAGAAYVVFSLMLNRWAGL